MFHLLAPVAMRIAISRDRCNCRDKAMLARLAQASSRTSPDAPSRIRKVGRAACVSSCSTAVACGANPAEAGYDLGYSRARLWLTAARSTFPGASVTPGFNLAYPVSIRPSRFAIIVGAERKGQDVVGI